MTVALRAPRRTPLLQVAKSVIAIVAAWLLAQWLVPGPPPVFAGIAALLVVQPLLDQSLARAIERSIGVIGGVIVASLLGIAFGESTWVILVATSIGLLLAWALRSTVGTANQVGISAMLVLALGAATPGYAVDRILETIIGAIVGVVVNVLIVPPVAIGPARTSVDAFTGELASTMDRLADALERPQTPSQLTDLLLQARLLRPMRTTADAAIETAAESLNLNPRSARYRREIEALTTRLDRFGGNATQIMGMTRAFTDRYDDGIRDEPAIVAIAEQLRRAAHDVRLQLDDADRAEASVAGDEPALTSMLVVPAPASDHWILLGSLLEDLRRIHETLSEEMA